MSRAASFALGVAASTAAYTFVFDSVWARAEHTAAGLRSIQRTIPDAQMVPRVHRPADPLVGVVATVEAFEGAAVRSAGDAVVAVGNAAAVGEEVVTAVRARLGV
jgi:hypothetical protein